MSRAVLVSSSRGLHSSSSKLIQEKGSEDFEFGHPKRSKEDFRQWYQKLKDQRFPTEFLSIAYMKERDTTFKHEFLLIYLLPTDSQDLEPDDCSFICRVERMGNGSHSNALFEGDHARDTIKIFSKSAYAKFETSCPFSVHVLDIRFQQRLDLFRILELCYAVQESNSAARYTLFKFNCYFMCWTILINLIRDLDKWSNRLDADRWETIVTQKLPRQVNDWIQRSLEEVTPDLAAITRPPAVMKHLPQFRTRINAISWYLCFHLPAKILGVESGRVVEIITDSIKAELIPARSQLINTIDHCDPNTLLTSTGATQLHEVVEKELLEHLTAAATRIIFQDEGAAGHELSSLLSDADSSGGSFLDALPCELRARATKKLHKQWFEYMSIYLASQEFWSQIQREPSTDESSHRDGYSESIALIPQLRIWKESYEYAVEEILGPGSNSTRKSLINRSYLNLNHWKFYRERILSVVLSYHTDVQTASRVIRRDYRILAIYTLLQLEPSNKSREKVDPRAWLKRCFTSKDWSYCLNICISKVVYDLLVELDGPSMWAKVGINEPVSWRYIQFYDFMKTLIAEHAEKAIKQIRDSERFV
ncbi:hypothetical protein RSOLAG1IB_00698 [Rhizoctonia solani AG-1 IB]|uniref:Uncharacterized protein n=1 Tax=Thanatephorus cucumeris (strain AG1-IB / isolate 7/3/14) TaxID=1108050 RepID=A0A0B7F5H3_THACB|nr:hypothetical protein RSOLAG1IB_00698 [Rhizoctonia solani AG-1 IB]